MKPVYTADLSPWARRAVGAAIDAALPTGYRITGAVAGGTASLHLYGPRWEHHVDQRVPVGSAAAAYRALVDMAWNHRRERAGLVVTTDGEGYISSIEATND